MRKLSASRGLIEDLVAASRVLALAIMDLVGVEG